MKGKHDGSKYSYPLAIEFRCAQLHIDAIMNKEGNYRSNPKLSNF